jgi:hypothetical protein
MPIKLDSGRQYESVAMLMLDYTQVTATTPMDAVDIPGGAIITGGEIDVITPFAPNVSMNLGDAANPTRYASGVALQTAGRTELTLSGYQHARPERLQAVFSAAGPTAGQAFVIVRYVVPGRSHYSQGEDGAPMAAGG